MKPGRVGYLRKATFAFACVAFIAAAPAETLSDISSNLDRVYTGDDYQRELPSGPGAGQQGPLRNPDDGQPLDNITIPELPEDIEDTEKGIFSANPVVELLLWVLLGVGFLLLGAHLYNAISRMRRPFAGTKEHDLSQGVEMPGQTDSPSDGSLSEIEKLATAGAFGEAVHLLLLHCFEQLRRRFPQARDPALTSREVLSHAALSPKALSGLSVIVAAVEAGHFGGKSIGQTTYERCLAGYRDISSADPS